ncbi:MAG: UDP-N-acetylmuramoyl-L-alanine--D-glutamate ligase [Spirochaetaceae bacterium]|nr:UDP-N-acetylmuramoyl-L-alanine--D-glutamate ligase [Spirochaetaceae bacterium]
MKKNDFSGARALVMGLGLHGGGLESAKFLVRRGAFVTVTDLRGEDVLAPSIKALDDCVRAENAAPVRYVLGRHEQADFDAADVALKNPGVRPDSPFLRGVRRIESDVSLFLNENPARLCAVTGSKGKSFTASAICFGLEAHHEAQNRGKVRLGGNIAVSPLTFLDDLTADDDVVLELSSWQLADLFLTSAASLFRPRVAVLTAIMCDHLDRYGTMEAYVADKRLIYKNQGKDDATIALDGEWGRRFLRETAGSPFLCGSGGLPEGAAGGWFDGESLRSFARGPMGSLGAGETVEIVGDALAPGGHQKVNLLGAALALLCLGVPPALIKKRLELFPGIEHRLEFFLEEGGVRYYNDSAATIPEAAAAAVAALGAPILVCGGADKRLDFSPLAKAARNAKQVILLAGSAGDKLTGLFAASGVPWSGPFETLEAAVEAAVECARPGDAVVLSPGCASFGMFLNEFDRGRKWKHLCRRLSGSGNAERLEAGTIAAHE